MLGWVALAAYHLGRLVRRKPRRIECPPPGPELKRYTIEIEFDRTNRGDFT